MKRQDQEESSTPAAARAGLALTLALATLLGACAGPPAEDEPLESLIIYSGRNEKLIGPILERFSQDTGIETRVRYGGTAELAATLLEEGEGTPAHVFLSQDAAALGALSREGRLHPLTPEVCDRVPPRFVSPRGDWIGLSGRVRTVVYNTELISPEDLPRTLEEVADPRHRGKFGIAPANASFQAHLAVYHAVRGRQALQELLDGIAANEPRYYPKNTPIVTAVLAGEVEWGLVNHYYLWRALQQDPQAPGANFVMPEGQASSFINLAGAGLVRDRPEARRLVDYLLSPEAQRFFAQETFEYPLVPGVPAHEGLQPLTEIPTPDVDFGQVSQVLPETLDMIQESGLLP